MRMIKFRNIISNISDSVDKETALKNENTFFAILLSMSLLFGSMVHFYVQYMHLNEPFTDVVRGSAMLFIFALIAILISFIKMEVFKMYLYSIEVSLVFYFIYYEFIEYLGPAIILVGLVFLVTMLIYSRIEIIIIYFSSFLFVISTSKINLSTFENWISYYIAKIIILLMIFVAVMFVYKVYKSRQEKIEKQYHEILLSKEKLYATLIAVGDGVIAVNNEGIVDYMNPVAEKLTAWNYEDAKDLHIEKIFKIYKEKTREVIKNPVGDVLSQKKILKISNDILLISKDNTEKLIEITSSPIRGENSQILGVVIVFRDVTKQRETIKEIERLSYCDHLTGLYNRRYFEEELKRIDIVENLPISFVFADVNGLKNLNDTFGHEAGDKLIKTVARNLKSACRLSDVVSRIGGDEFVILLSKTDDKMANKIVESIYSNLKKENVMEREISVAVGRATKENEEELSVDILNKAEENMYVEKNRLKNKEQKLGEV